MRLEGSCHCGKVHFHCESVTPYPFMYCYCSICRKTTGGLFGCNIMGDRETLHISGHRHARQYHARIRDPGKKTVVSQAERWFCQDCGTHLFLLDERWPEGVWPNAGAIDTPLPAAPENVHMMVASKPEWVPILGRGPQFPEYPDDVTIFSWHEEHDLLQLRGRPKPGRKVKAKTKGRTKRSVRKSTDARAKPNRMSKTG